MKIVDKPCETCGHPGPFVPKVLPAPDPRVGMKVLCACCKKDITWDTHQWQHEPDGRYVCCACMAPTKRMRDLPPGKKETTP